MENASAAQAFSALAHESRLAVFRLLVREGPDGLAAGEIAEIIGLTATALSFHLKELERAGLVLSRRDGRYIRYSLNAGGIRELVGFLVADCCSGQPALCGVLPPQQGWCAEGREKDAGRNEGSH